MCDILNLFGQIFGQMRLGNTKNAKLKYITLLSIYFILISIHFNQIELFNLTAIK